MEFLLTPECYNEYFKKSNFLHGACFTATLSKLLGLIIIAGCSVLKIPQIIKIYQTGSGEGISILSIALELMANTIYMSYSYLNNFPFSAWGEMLFLVTQTLIIGMLVLHYDGASERAAALGITYFTFFLIFMSGMIPVNVLWNLQGINILVLLSARLIQAYKNLKNGHTGQLSAITVNLLFLGSIARIFTSIQETGDFMSILGNTVGAVGHAILAAQIWYYWDVDKRQFGSYLM